MVTRLNLTSRQLTWYLCRRQVDLRLAIRATHYRAREAWFRRRVQHDVILLRQSIRLAADSKSLFSSSHQRDDTEYDLCWQVLPLVLAAAAGRATL